MNNLMGKFVQKLGFAGMILYYVVIICFTVAPLWMLNFPVWIKVVIAFASVLFPTLYSYAAYILYIWAFVLAIQGPQDIFAIVFYIFFAIWAVMAIMDIVRIVQLHRLNR